jgi:hypothetical protein
MDQPGLSKAAYYQHHQAWQAEAQGTAAANPVRTVNHREPMRTEVIPIDRPANKEDILIRSPILIHNIDPNLSGGSQAGGDDETKTEVSNDSQSDFH